MINMSGLNVVVENHIKKLTEELAELKGEKMVESKGADVKKNHKPGKADPSKKYVLLTRTMPSWGKVPQQQSDLADLLSRSMEVGKEYTEVEVFNAIIDGCGDYKSLVDSVQDPTYVFRYYRGLKNDGKRASFVARNFLRVIA